MIEVHERTSVDEFWCKSCYEEACVTVSSSYYGEDGDCLECEEIHLCHACLQELTTKLAALEAAIKAGLVDNPVGEKK